MTPNKRRKYIIGVFTPRQTTLTRAIAEFDEKMAQFDEIQALIENLIEDEAIDSEIATAQEFRSEACETRDRAMELLLSLQQSVIQPAASTPSEAGSNTSASAQVKAAQTWTPSV